MKRFNMRRLPGTLCLVLVSIFGMHVLHAEWVAVPKGDFKDIDPEAVAVGHSDSVWCVGRDQSLYQLRAAAGKKTDGWRLRAENEANGVATGYDNAVFVVQADGDVWHLKDKVWAEVKTGAYDFKKVAAVSKTEFYGLTDDKKIIHFKDGTITILKGKDGKENIGFTDVSSNGAGTVFLVDVNGDVYQKGTEGVSKAKMDEVKKSREKKIEKIKKKVKKRRRRRRRRRRGRRNSRYRRRTRRRIRRQVIANEAAKTIKATDVVAKKK